MGLIFFPWEFRLSPSQLIIQNDKAAATDAETGAEAGAESGAEDRSASKENAQRSVDEEASSIAINFESVARCIRHSWQHRQMHSPLKFSVVSCGAWERLARKSSQSLCVNILPQTSVDSGSWRPGWRIIFGYWVKTCAQELASVVVNRRCVVHIM